MSGPMPFTRYVLELDASIHLIQPDRGFADVISGSD